MKRMVCGLILAGSLVSAAIAEVPTSDVMPVILMRSEVSVIEKRLPTRMGLDAMTVPYKVAYGRVQGSVRTVGDVLERETGVRQYNMSTSEVDQMLAMGGFSDSKYTAMIVDGIRYNAEDDSLYNYWLPLESIGRYELKRGADSSVYGSGGFGGTVHLYRRTDMKPFVKIEAGGLGYGSQTVGTGWSAGDLYGTVVADHKSADGYRERSDYELSGIDLMQGIYLNSEHTRAFEYGYQTSRGYTGYADVLTDDEMSSNPMQSYASDERRSSTEVSVLRYKDTALPDLSLQADYYRKNSDITYTSVSRGGTGSRTFSVLSTDGFVGQFDHRKDLVLSSEVWTLGFDVARENVHYKRFALDLDAQAARDKESDQYSDRSSTAYFMSYTGVAAERFTVDLGARQDTVHYDLYRVMGYDNTAWPSPIKLGRSYDTADLQVRTHHAGVFWDVHEKNGIFANYRQGFRAPSYYEMYDVAGWSGNYDVTALDPERAYTAEAGIRTYPVPGMKAELSSYQTRMEDEIVYVTDPVTWKGRNENVQETVRYGAELSIEHQLSTLLRYKLGYAACRAYFVDGPGNDLNGKVIPLVPEEEWRAAIGWRFMSDYMLTLRHSIVGRQYALSDTTNDYDMLPAYGVSDLDVRYQQEFYEIYAAVHNLFNTVYQTYGLVAWPGTDYRMPSDPRSVIVGTKLTF